MSEGTENGKRPQYTVAFLAGSFGLTQAQAVSILAAAGDDRLVAAEQARLQKARNN
jgi:hypothetical protein